LNDEWGRMRKEAMKLLLWYSLNKKVLIQRKYIKLVIMLNLAPYHEEVRRSGGIAPHVLNFGTRWR